MYWLIEITVVVFRLSVKNPHQSQTLLSLLQYVVVKVIIFQNSPYTLWNINILEKSLLYGRDTLRIVS